MKTTLYTVLCVAVRLGAVLMAVGILERVPGLFYLSGTDGHFLIGILLLNGAGLLVAFALWMWPKILVWWAIGRNRHEILESSINADQLQYIAFSVVGAWMLIGGLSGCVGHGVMILVVAHESASNGLSGMVSTDEWHWLVQYATTAIAGGALILGSRGLVGLLHRLRGYPHYMAAGTGDDTGTTQDS